MDPRADASTPDQPTDDQRMAAAARGDTAAFRDLVLRYQSRVYRYLQAALRHADDALDAAQETFLLVYEQRARYEARGKFEPWLFAIARRIALEKQRDRKRRAREAAVPPRDPAAAPDDNADLYEAIHALPESDRDIVLLRAFSGLSHADIAAQLELSEDVCRKRYSRALHELRALLK